MHGTHTQHKEDFEILLVFPFDIPSGSTYVECMQTKSGYFFTRENSVDTYSYPNQILLSL